MFLSRNTMRRVRQIRFSDRLGSPVMKKCSNQVRRSSFHSVIRATMPVGPFFAADPSSVFGAADPERIDDATGSMPGIDGGSARLPTDPIGSVADAPALSPGT